MIRRFVGEVRTLVAIALLATAFTTLTVGISSAKVGNAVQAQPSSAAPAEQRAQTLQRSPAGAENAARVFDDTANRPGSRIDPMDTSPFIFLLFPSGYYDPLNEAVSLLVADVNRDGKADLIVVCGNAPFATGVVSVLLGNGDGTFQPAVAYNIGGYGTGQGAVADVNGDGKPDLVIASCVISSCLGEGSAGVLLGNGDGTFQPAINYDAGTPYFVPSMVVGDVNGDGKPDILMTGQYCFDPGGCENPGAVYTLLGNGDGTFQSAVPNQVGFGPGNSITVADVNGDGKPDVLFTGGVLLGNGDGTFQPTLYFSAGGSFPYSVAAQDVNGDGKPDAVVAHLDGTVDVLLGNGDGTFQPPVVYDSPGPFPFGGPVNVTIADVNRDGKPDLIVNSSSAVGVLLGNGDGTFQSVTYYRTYYSVWTTVADVNGDGRPDAIVIDGNRLGVLLNNVGAPASTISLASSTNPVTVKQPVTYAVAVTGPSGEKVNGSVEFTDGGGFAGLVPLTDNQATLTTLYTNLGSHTITAVYSGDLNRASGSISNVLTESVRGTSITKETTSGSPSQAGQPVTFTALVTSKYGAIQNGEMVTFADGKTFLGSVGLSAGRASFTTSGLSGGSHVIKATYAGDAVLAPSMGSVKQVVNKYATTISVVSSLNPSSHKQAVTFAATVTSAGPTPTGKVIFSDGTIRLGSGTLSGGIAKLTRSNLAVGSHSITAQYVGDGASSASTSPVLSQLVNP
jgi:hypothetical protein